MQKILRTLSILLIVIESLLLGRIYMSVGHVKDYNEQISLGDKYLEEMDYENAEVCYNKAIHIDEKQARPYLQLAVLYYDSDRQEEALDILEQGEKNKVYSEAEEESVEEIRETINAEENKKDGEEGSEEENSEKEDEQTKMADREELLKRYQDILFEYFEVSQCDDTYLYQHQDEFPNADTIYARFYSDLYYRLYDIDKNGVDELLLFWKYETADGEYKYWLFDVYAYNGKTAEKLFFKESSAWHNEIKVYTDGTMYVFETAGSTRLGTIKFYKLAENGYTPIMTERYKVDKETHQDTPYYNDLEALTESQFEEKLSSYTDIPTDDLRTIGMVLWNYHE